MNFFPFHIGDYASATRHLTWEEDMAYRRLLDAYYVKEGPLPADERSIFRLVCASTEDQRQAVLTVLEEFFEPSEDGWRHGRCDAEITKAQEKREKASESAKAKWRKARDQVVVMPPQCERNANADKDACERIETTYEGNAPNPNPNPNPKVNLEEAIASSAPSRKRLEAAAIPKINFDFTLGQWDGISETDASAWESAYPAIVIDTELYRAAEWVKANPANRKSNWRRFLTNWFSRAQERAPRRAA